jgi:hypothetical protein
MRGGSLPSEQLEQLVREHQGMQELPQLAYSCSSAFDEGQQD